MNESFVADGRQISQAVWPKTTKTSNLHARSEINIRWSVNNNLYLVLRLYTDICHYFFRETKGSLVENCELRAK